MKCNICGHNHEGHHYVVKTVCIDALQAEVEHLRESNEIMSQLLDRIKYAWFVRYDDSIDEALTEWDEISEIRLKASDK